MNSLNLLSSRVIGQAQLKKRSRSVGEAIRSSPEHPPQPKRSVSQHVEVKLPLDEEDTEKEKEFTFVKQEEAATSVEDLGSYASEETHDEKTPLLSEKPAELPTDVVQSDKKRQTAIAKIMSALSESLKWIISKLLAPGVYLLAYFKNENGRFSPVAPFHRSRAIRPTKKTVNSTAHAVGLSGSSDRSQFSEKTKRGLHSETPATSDSELDARGAHTGKIRDPNRLSQSSSDDGGHVRRSIRIKLNNEDSARRRKQKRSAKTASEVAESGDATQEELAAASLKSPTSPASSLGMTRYPHAPSPPRPLIPRRQPSYTAYDPSKSSSLTKKTLVIDLDETLIHSLAKGGRMSSGHMVEVKLSSGYGGVAHAPQHPILYYVHKRPYCDEFLRKISRWYNLVVFTASVQEYADPVIDWLEIERKYFSARYYRQHCTFRNGAYIKDLSSVEPDLSKVMILDNSPLSYIFHEPNAIPIEGWINDPTDNDLLHLIPLLEGLQYVTDVRALLSLRQGEVEATQ